MRMWLVALWVIAVLCLCLGVPKARADVGGNVPGPGLCDYPFIGHSEMIGAGPVANVYTYMCDGPTEINGSHWHAELTGEAVQAAVSAGISLAFINAGVSASGNLGALGGSTSWRCPDNTLADWPNPPGAWKNSITPTKCKTIGPAPAPRDQPDDPEQLQPAPSGLAPVTNPENPNPEATVNHP